jgi:hypothetical protein
VTEAALRVVVVDDVSSMREGLCAQFRRIPDVEAEQLSFEEAEARAGWDDVDWVVSDAAFDLRYRPEFEDAEPTPAVPLISSIRQKSPGLRPRIVVVTSCPATWNEEVVRRRLAEVDREAHYIERAEFQRQFDALLGAASAAESDEVEFTTEVHRLLRSLPDVGSPEALEDLGITPLTRLNPLLAELRDLLKTLRSSRTPRRTQERLRIQLAAKHGLEPVRADGSRRPNGTARTDQFEGIEQRSRALPEQKQVGRRFRRK